MKKLILALFLFTPVTFFLTKAVAQTTPTTLNEVVGEYGFTIKTENSSENLTVGSWVQGANMPYPRYYSGSVTYTRNDTLWLYVIGGDTTGAGHATASCLRYNVNTNTWAFVAPLPVPMRTNAATRLGDKIYTMGGFSAPFPSPALNLFFEYDINTNSWTPLPNIPQTVFFHGAEGFEDSLIYIIGGIEYTPSPSRSEVWLKKIWLYNLNEQNFRPASDMPEATASFGHSLYVDKFIITAGLKSNTELWNFTLKGEISQSDRAQINWTFQENYGLSVYAHYGANFPNYEIYFGGGSNTVGFTPVNNVFGYLINSNSYEKGDPLPISGMAYSAGTNYFENHRSGFEIVKLVIAGGVTTGPTITNQTWIFTDTIDVQGIKEINGDIPHSYSLLQNYPNPFNPSTTIQFSIPEQSYVKLEVFNSLGEKITTLVSEELNAGNYKYEWNAEGLSSGIYFYKIWTTDFEQTKKLILLK